MDVDCLISSLQRMLDELSETPFVLHSAEVQRAMCAARRSGLYVWITEHAVTDAKRGRHYIRTVHAERTHQLAHAS